jgi:hypothetical protein
MNPAGNTNADECGGGGIRVCALERPYTKNGVGVDGADGSVSCGSGCAASSVFIVSNNNIDGDNIDVASFSIA